MQEAYTAAKPGLQAMQASATKYWQAASESLAPQLEQLAQTGAHYHRQVSGVVANVSQQVTGTQLHPDVLQFAQVRSRSSRTKAYSSADTACKLSWANLSRVILVCSGLLLATS